MLNIVNNKDRMLQNQGFSIYLVLIIISIAAVLLSVTITRVGGVRTQAAAELNKFQSRMLAESGIIRAEYFLSGGDGHSLDWKTDNYVETIGTFGKIKIQISPYGCLSRIISSGQRHTYECSISGFIGRSNPRLLQPALTLTMWMNGLDGDAESSVNGEIVLKGGRVNLSGKKVNYIQQNLLPSLPFDSLAVKYLVNNYSLSLVSSLSKKGAVGGNVTLSSSTDSLLKEDTIVILGDCNIYTTVTNKFFFISGNLNVNNNATITNSIFLCEKCEIDNSSTSNSVFFSVKKLSVNRGRHNSQFIASDSVAIDNNATFNQSNICINYRELEDSIVSGGILIEKNTYYNGILISCIDSNAFNKTADASIVIGQGTKLSGTVVTDHVLYMKDVQIKGHVWARQIMSDDGKITYSNKLIKTTIDASVPPQPFPLFHPGPFSLLFSNDAIRYSKHNK